MLKSLSLTILALCTSLSAWAESTQKYMLVSENKIKFDQYGEFFEKQKSIVAAYEAYGKLSIYSFYGNRMWLNVSANSLNTFEQLQLSTAHSSALGDNLNSNITERSTFILKYRPELSFLPNKPRIKPEDIKYVRKMRFYIKPTKVNEALAVMAEFKKLFQQHKIQTVVKVYTGFVDEGLPYIDIFRFGKSAEDYHRYEDFVNKTFGYQVLGKLMQPFAQALAGEEVDEGKVIIF